METERFKCPHCPCSYVWKPGLQKHLRQKHAPGSKSVPRKAFQCACGKGFTTRDSLEKHLIKQDGWWCLKCSRGYHKTTDQLCCEDEPTLERVIQDQSEEEEIEPEPDEPMEQPAEQPAEAIEMDIETELEYSRGWDEAAYTKHASIYAQEIFLSASN